MNKMLQLNPPIPMITPKGKAYAYFVTDYSQDHDLFWTCAQQDTGECWTWRNSQIRFDENITIGRNKPTLT